MSKGCRLTKKVRGTISKYRMIQPGDLVVVAVSGGPDSIGLLHVLHRLMEEMRVGLIAAHFDHGWRPGEDQAETELVRALAHSLRIPFETEQAGKILGGGAVSREEAARDARYAFLERVRAAHSASRIAVGHHLNDQAETLLMRLLRGSGVSGLGAIPPVRDGRIVRPLIEVTRPQIETYLKENGLRYAIDSSNLNAGLLRNRVRLELIPLLLKYQPRLIERLAETADLLREESGFLDSLSAEWIGKEGSALPEGIRMPVTALIDLPPALRRRVIRTVLLRVKGNIRRIGSRHIHAVEELAGSERPQAFLNLPDGLQVRRAYGEISVVRREESQTSGFSLLLEEPGTFFIPEIRKSLSLELIKEKERGPAVSQWTAFLDAEKARFPLAVRPFKPGDRFVPLGMTGHKKVKDFFVDLKVPTAVRHTTPMLVMGDTILWVAGYRIDERFKVTASTRMVLEARLDKAVSSEQKAHSAKRPEL